MSAKKLFILLLLFLILLGCLGIGIGAVRGADPLPILRDLAQQTLDFLRGRMPALPEPLSGLWESPAAPAG